MPEKHPGLNGSEGIDVLNPEQGLAVKADERVLSEGFYKFIPRSSEALAVASVAVSGPRILA